MSPAPERLIVRLPNWVGDVVMATPTLLSLRQGLPRCEITLMGKASARLLLEGLDVCDTFLPFDRHGQQSGTLSFLKVASALRRQRYDTGLILPNSPSSALLFALGGIKRRIGYNRHGRGALLTHPVPVKREKGRFIPVPMIKYYLNLVEALGVTPVTEHPRLAVSPEDQAWAAELWKSLGISEGQPVVCVTPGAAFGPSKQWPPPYFSQVADRLRSELGARVLFLPGPAEEPLMREIARTCVTPPEFLSPEQTPLNRLKAIIARCNLLLTNDTGPRHIAVALDRPVVVLMGPTDPRYTAMALEKTVVLRKDVPCGPCMLKKCPKDHACMRQLTPDEVFRACQESFFQ